MRSQRGPRAKQRRPYTGQYTIRVFQRTWPLTVRAIASVAAVTMLAPIAVDARAQSTDVATPIVIEPAADLDRHRDRVMAAADRASAAYREWLGPCPAPPRVRISLPTWSAPRTMDVESQVAFAVARLWWPALQGDRDARQLADGLSWYLQSRVVEDIYSTASFAAGHSDEGVRFFGGAWPWSFRVLSLDRWTAGLGRPELLAQTRGRSPWPLPARRPPPGFDDATPRVALAFGTVERLIGWPTLQGALRVLAASAAAGDMTGSDVVRTLSAAAGQDLAWIFTPALDPAQSFDYALESLSTVEGSCGDRPCYTTRVVAARRGTAAFSGTSRLRAGEYQGGDALEVRVTFTDRQVVTVRWDGRDASRTFEFESPAPAVAAHLDPDRVLLLDRNYLDNTQVLDGATNVPVAKWIARWMVWLQDAALTYSALF